MWSLKLIVSEEQALFWGFQHTFLGFPTRYMEKMLIFQVNLGMWPLKSIISLGLSYVIWKTFCEAKCKTASELKFSDLPG